MECLKCGLVQDSIHTECPRCGIVFAKALRTERLRWALLILGALAFMDVYRVWSGPFDHLPFGEDERGLSDPAVLAEEFGWSVLLLVNRYLELARACFVVLALAYAMGIAQLRSVER